MVAVPASIARPARAAAGFLMHLPWVAWAGVGALALLMIARPAKAAAEPAPTQPSGAPPVIKLGSTGPWVGFLQGKLGLAQSGTFDAATDAAVKAFQGSHELMVDGIVGPKTWTALGVAGVAPPPSGGAPSGTPKAPPGPAPSPVAPSAPTVGNPFGLSPMVQDREGQILAHIAQGNTEHQWVPLDYTADGHQVHMLVSRRAYALSDGTNRLMVSMTFNGAQKVADAIGGAMLTTRISDEIWRHAGTKIGIPNKSWNTDSPVTGGKTDRMYQQSDDVQAKVLAKGNHGLVANEGKDWVLTRRYWGQPTQGKHPLPAGTDAPAGVSGSKHNAGNFGWYPGASSSDGGEPVTQPVGLAHDRGNAGGFVDYSQTLRFMRPDSLTIDGVPWDYAAALADPSVSYLIQDEGGTIPGARHPDT